MTDQPMIEQLLASLHVVLPQTLGWKSSVSQSQSLARSSCPTSNGCPERICLPKSPAVRFYRRW